MSLVLLWVMCSVETPILLHTTSRQSWNSEDVKNGRPASAHSFRTYPWVWSDADQLTVPPPPHVSPAMTTVELSSATMISRRSRKYRATYRRENRRCGTAAPSPPPPAWAGDQLSSGTLY